MLLWLSLLFKRRRSSPHNVESAGRLTCAFYNLQLFPIMFVWAEGYKVVRMMPIALEKGTYGLPEKEQLVQTNFI